MSSIEIRSEKLDAKDLSVSSFSSSSSRSRSSVQSQSSHTSRNQVIPLGTANAPVEIVDTNAPPQYKNLQQLVATRLEKYKLTTMKRERRRAQNLSFQQIQTINNQAQFKKYQVAQSNEKPHTPNLFDVLSMYDDGEENLQRWRKDVSNKRITEIDTRDSIEDLLDEEFDRMAPRRIDSSRDEKRQTNTRVLKRIRANEQAQKEREILLFVQQLKRDYERQHPSEAAYHVQGAAPKNFKNAKDELLHKCAQKDSYLQYKRQHKFLKRKRFGSSEMQAQNITSTEVDPRIQVEQSQSVLLLSPELSPARLSGNESHLRRLMQLTRNKNDILPQANTILQGRSSSLIEKGPKRQRAPIKALPPLQGDSLKMIREETNRSRKHTQQQKLNLFHQSNTSMNTGKNQQSRSKLSVQNFQVFNVRFKRGESRQLDGEGSMIDLSSPNKVQLKRVSVGGGTAGVPVKPVSQTQIPSPQEFSNSLSNLMASRVPTLDSTFKQQIESTMPAIQLIQGEKDSRAQLQLLNSIMEVKEQKLAQENPHLQTSMALKRVETLKKRAISEKNSASQTKAIDSFYQNLADGIQSSTKHTETAKKAQPLSEQILKEHLDFMENFINDSFKRKENFLQNEVFVIFFEGLRIIYSQQLKELSGENVGANNLYSGARQINARKNVQEKLETLNAFQKCVSKFCGYNQILSKLEKRVMSMHQKVRFSLGSIERFYEVLRENDFPPLEVAKMLLVAKVAQNREENSEMRSFVDEIKNERLSLLFNKDYIASEKLERSRQKKRYSEWRRLNGLDQFRINL